MYDLVRQINQNRSTPSNGEREREVHTFSSLTSQQLEIGTGWAPSAITSFPGLSKTGHLSRVAQKDVVFFTNSSPECNCLFLVFFSFGYSLLVLRRRSPSDDGESRKRNLCNGSIGNPGTCSIRVHIWLHFSCFSCWHIFVNAALSSFFHFFFSFYCLSVATRWLDAGQQTPGRRMRALNPIVCPKKVNETNRKWKLPCFVLPFSKKQVKYRGRFRYTRTAATLFVASQRTIWLIGISSLYWWCRFLVLSEDIVCASRRERGPKTGLP